MQAPVPGLVEGGVHDVLGDGRDLEVHLQGRHANLRAGHLEVHVAQMVLVAEDVGEHGEAVVLLDQAHGDAGHRSWQGNARVISAREAPQTLAMDDEPLDSVISDTTRMV